MLKKLQCKKYLNDRKTILNTNIKELKLMNSKKSEVTSIGLIRSKNERPVTILKTTRKEKMKCPVHELYLEKLLMSEKNIMLRRKEHFEELLVTNIGHTYCRKQTAFSVEEVGEAIRKFM